jgi:hypothetical protein
MSRFQKKPIVEINANFKICIVWEDILSQPLSFSNKINKDRKIISVEFYHGVFEDKIVKEFQRE